VSLLSDWAAAGGSGGGRWRRTKKFVCGGGVSASPVLLVLYSILLVSAPLADQATAMGGAAFSACWRFNNCKQLN
jgi:hypothetical protein